MKFVTATILSSALCLGLGQAALADEYQIDTKGQHAAITFKVSHLGYSFVLGRFNEFDGSYTYDPENPEDTRIEVTINVDSIDSAHAERDKHLRSSDFLHVDEFPTATFKSTSYTENEDGSGTMTGELTLRGQTQEITLDTQFIGAGEDPWGNYRSGFEATTTLNMPDFGIPDKLGPQAREAEMYMTIEGIRQ